GDARQQRAEESETAQECAADYLSHHRDGISGPSAHGGDHRGAGDSAALIARETLLRAPVLPRREPRHDRESERHERRCGMMVSLRMQILLALTAFAAC